MLRHACFPPKTIFYRDPFSYYRKRKKKLIIILTYLPFSFAAGFRSISAVDTAAAQRARARAQYSNLARLKVTSGTASLRKLQLFFFSFGLFNQCMTFFLISYCLPFCEHTHKHTEGQMAQQGNLICESIHPVCFY